MSDICAEERKKNLGKSKCTALPKLMKGGIITPNNLFLEPADYATPAALKAKLQSWLKNPINSRAYLLPRFSTVEDNSETAIYEETSLARIPVRDGQYRYMPMISHNLCTHKALFTHRAINEGRIFWWDVDNQLFGTEPDADGNIYGFTLSLFWTEKLRISLGTESTKSPIVIDLADNEEVDKHGVLLSGAVVAQLDPLTDVSITLVGDVLGTGFQVEVKQTCDGVPVSGLLLADFVMYNAAGTATQAILSAAENANIPGRYTILAPTVGPDLFEDGTLTLRAPNLLTAAVGAYECNDPLTVNVP